MMITRCPRALSGMFDIMIDADVGSFARIQATALIRLDQLSDHTRRQAVLNLTRGWCSSLSGPSFKLYHILAGRFGFPVFAIGRGSAMLVSCREGPKAAEELALRFAPLWQLGKDAARARSWRQMQFHWCTRPGPTPGWTMLNMSRPNGMTIDGVLATGGWKSIFDVVPKYATLAAIAAVQRRETLEFQL